MEIVYADPRIVVAVKPTGVLSTDEPGGMPQLLRQELMNVLKSLTPREERVLTLRFGLDDGQPRTLEELGREFTRSGSISKRTAISSAVGSRPFFRSSSPAVFLTRLMCSTKCTGMRMVRPWSAMARVTDWRIHHVA